MKPKIRIQLLTPTFELISDRLVDQYEEFIRGPKDPHNGPIKIEFTLDSPKTLEELKQYLDKTMGLIDIDVPKVRTSNAGRKPTQKGDKADVSPTDLWDKIKSAPYQEDVITLFKRNKFSILSSSVTKEVMGKFMREKDANFNFWAKRTHIEMLDPKNDVYDFKLIIGLKYVGDKVDKIVCYKNNEFFGFCKKEWKVNSSINFKVKKKGLKFPPQMTLDQRKDWRTLDKKTKSNKEIKKADRIFYEKWAPIIDKLNKSK